MAKFMVLYNSSLSASEVMANASPEQVQASMAEWIQWREAASKTVKVDFGMPLQAVGNVTPTGVGESHTPVSGYAMLEGDKEAVMELLKTHPHLKRTGASIDVLEFLSMPGLENAA